MQRIAAFVCLLCVPILFLQAASNSGINSSAGWNGFYTAKIAYGLFQQKAIEEQSPTVVASERALALARQGYSSEPLATSALVVLAHGEALLNDEPRRRELIRMTVQLHRRDKVAQALAVQELIKLEDFDPVFEHFDDLAAMRSELIEPLVTALQPLLGSSDGRQVLTDALAVRPAWQGEFWKSVPSNDLQFEGYLALMNELQPQLDDGGLAKVVTELVRRERFNEAHALSEPRLGDLMSPNWFADAPILSPIGWSLASETNLRMVPLADRRYSIFIGRTESGLLARQLVTLRPGAYRLQAQITGDDVRKALRVRLMCNRSAPGRVEQGWIGIGELLNADESCQIYWLELSGDAWEAATDLRSEISNLSLVRERY